MNINEVLQGLNNLGGEMPRITKPKRIKEIKPGKKNKNVKARKGPMNIDLSKLEGKANQLKANSKVTKKVTPTTGHESPNINRGMLVGSKYNEAEDDQIRNAKADAAARRQSSRTSEFNWKEFYEWVFTNAPGKTGKQIAGQRDALIIQYQNAMNKARGEKVLNKKATDYSKEQQPITQRDPKLQAKINQEMDPRNEVS